MACILEELENTLKKQLGNTKNSKEFKEGATKAKERVAELSTLLNEVGAMKKVMQGQVNTETNVSNYDKPLADKIANKLQKLYSHIEVAYLNGQTEMRAVLEELSGDLTMFQLSKKRKDEFEQKLRKARPELDEVNIDSILNNIEKFSETESNGNEKLMKKLELLSLHWTIKGNVILPEDGSKILDALKIADKNKFDPFSYNSPNEITESFAKVEDKVKPLDPNDYLGKGFSNKQVHGDTAVYNVDNTEVGRKVAREAIDTHFGVDANPWCLLAKDGNGSIEESASYWFDTYPGPKKIVFINGKLSYFYGGDKFWNRMDSPSDLISTKDLDLSKEDIKKYKLSSYLKDPANYIYKKVNLKVDNASSNVESSDEVISIEKHTKTDSVTTIDRIELGYNGKIENEGVFEILKNNKNQENPIGKHVHYRGNGKVMTITEYDSNYEKILYEGYSDKGILIRKEEVVTSPIKGTLVTSYFITGEIKSKEIQRRGKPPVIIEEYFSKDIKKFPSKLTRFLDVDSEGRITHIEKIGMGDKHVSLDINHKTLEFTYTDASGVKETEKLDSVITNDEIVGLAKDVLYYQKTNNDIIKGAAIISKNKILIDITNRSTDTLAHEYAHFYIAGFRNTPIVQEAIKKWGSEEALVQAIGEETVAKKGNAYGFWKRFSKWLKDLVASLDKASKEDLVKALTDAFLTNADLNTDAKKTTSVDGGLVNNKGFNGYISIKDIGGKGSVEGDAKDIAMREVADGFVGEISNGRLNNSSTGTSYNALKDSVSGPTSAGSITYHGAAEPSTVMLARNGSFRGKPLNSETKEAIEYYFQEGASFVVGDMPGVDSQFINYLDEIGASYKIYHTGNSPRIAKEDIKYQKVSKDNTKQEVAIIVPTETFEQNVNRKIECKE